MKVALLPFAMLLAIASMLPFQANAQSNELPTVVHQPPSGTTSEVSQQTTASPHITHYTLPPDRDQKARAISKVRLRLLYVNLVYGFVVLWTVLHLKLPAKFRDTAESISARRLVQAMVFSPLLILTIDVMSLPTGIYDNWIQRAYGLSVQGWGSWFWDWTKGEIISVILSTLVIWILYGVIRKSPEHWWFYFWIVTIPMILALIFLQPLVTDPLFHKFEPLQQKDPGLTAELQKMVARAGQDIPPERMFWMGAGEKTTEVNAYVAGFGASKRIVVWDTTIARMNTPQIVFVSGHEMGHYVLHHIPKGIAFAMAVLFVTFYIGFRLTGWLLALRGRQWGIRGLEDWASLPAMLLLLSVISTIVGPVLNTYSRYQEHQADQYGLEITHGMISDSGQVAAQAFNVLGEVDLADPDPNPMQILLFYNHPAIPDRIQYCLSYDPWGKGESGEFVK